MHLTRIQVRFSSLAPICPASHTGNLRSHTIGRASELSASELYVSKLVHCSRRSETFQWCGKERWMVSLFPPSVPQRRPSPPPLPLCHGAAISSSLIDVSNSRFPTASSHKRATFKVQFPHVVRTPAVTFSPAAFIRGRACWMS